ncbi:hypothetical protein SDC9_150517 [bioreactor metagenome]|uniref:Uncharacterized protein n=1 Tax=bioreactor metagenome TaxID=1076179 RepID=A0A645EPL0_9ZZZZ
MLAKDHHVVTQVVEAKFVVGAVGDVAVIGRLLFQALHAVDHAAHAHTEEAVDFPHPLCVALGEVIIHRDHMHAATGERVEIGRQCRHKGFTFACLHLGDAPLMQHHAAQQLHVKMPHVDGAHRGFPDGRKRLDHDIIQRFAVCQPLTK